jgi:serine protease
MLWASRRADVVNLSLAGAMPSQAMCDAVARAATRALVVVSVGNTAGKVSYPAACPDAVAVGAVRFDGKVAPYSNHGRAVDIVAPGGDSSRDQNRDGYEDSILQETYAGVWSFSFFEGTSMAAAHVSGVAALVLETYPDANVRRMLLRSSRDLGPDGKDPYYGKGAVDAQAAVALAAFKARRAG